MDACRHEGKETQGLMRSLKDACGQYRNFSAGSLPESMWTAPEQRKHVHTPARSAGVQGHAHVRGAASGPQQRPLKIAAAKNDVGQRSEPGGGASLEGAFSQIKLGISGKPAETEDVLLNLEAEPTHDKTSQAFTPAAPAN